MITAFKRLDHI